MATALQGFRLSARFCRFRSQISKSIERRRAFSTSTPRRVVEGDELDDYQESVPQKDLPRSKIPPINQTSLLWDVRPEEREKYLKGLQTVGKTTYDPELLEAIEEELTETPRESGVMNLYDPPVKRKKKLKETFLNMGDPEPFEDEDFDFEGDTHEDITSMGHGELEHHREMRHYARLTAWEMPLLSKFAKPFVPPTADMVLRFRYTTYLGEQHPAENKVVMEFCTRDMPNLTPVQREKLVKLAGVRYNPEKDLVKISCEMFPSQAQNKRYLGDLVEKMLREARDPKDTFEDVPADMRHHKFKPKPRFPEAWKMTEERRKELASHRENAELKDQRRLLTGQLIDGIKQIEAAFTKAPAPTPFAEMAMAGKGGKRLAVKR